MIDANHLGPALRAWAADRRGVGAEALYIGGVQLLPPLGRAPWQGRAVQVVGEGVEAGVPAGGVAGGLADLVEGVDEREQAAVAVGAELEVERLVVAPLELEQGGGIEG